MDGTVVFVDPISFSVLKKIKLNYADYEVPVAVQQSIRQLKLIFEKIQETQGKTVHDIFADIMNRDNEEVKNRDFVAKLMRLDPSLDEGNLHKCVQQLDVDSSETITLDEFLEFFGDVTALDAMNQNVNEDDILDDLWPERMIKEGKI